MAKLNDFESMRINLIRCTEECIIEYPEQTEKYNKVIQEIKQAKTPKELDTIIQPVTDLVCEYLDEILEDYQKLKDEEPNKLAARLSLEYIAGGINSVPMDHLTLDQVTYVMLLLKQQADEIGIKNIDIGTKLRTKAPLSTQLPSIDFEFTEKFQRPTYKECVVQRIIYRIYREVLINKNHPSNVKKVAKIGCSFNIVPVLKKHGYIAHHEAGYLRLIID